MIVHFGEPYPSAENPAPLFEDTERVPTPVGAECVWCEEPIEEEDRGLVTPYMNGFSLDEAVYHHECFVRSVLGSVAHQEGRCACHGGVDDEDTAFPSARAAAVAALRLAERSWYGVIPQERADGRIDGPTI